MPNQHAERLRSINQMYPHFRLNEPANEIDRLQNQLDAWHEAFGTKELSVATTEFDNAFKKCERLKKRNRELCEVVRAYECYMDCQLDCQCDTCIKARALLAQEEPK